MMAEKDLTKSQLKMLEIVAAFPEGVTRRDLFAIYNGKKTIQEVKFEYSIQEFNLRKNERRHKNTKKS